MREIQKNGGINDLNSVFYISKCKLTISVQCRSPHFKLVHLNIRSLRNTAHLTQLKEFLSKTKTEALTLSETWLNTTITNAEIYIEGYTLYRQDRLNKRGGGVCAYIRNDIKVSSFMMNQLNVHLLASPIIYQSKFNL
jgi:hypothetical protein